jgi:predicted GNAT family N-acyltransferase
MITTFEFGTPAYDESIRLRDDILRKPLGLVFFAEDLAKEYNQVHFGYYENEKLIGCMVLHDYGDKNAKMRQVAVAETHQKRGIGQKMVTYFEAYAKVNGYKKVVLHARDVACPFYEKLNYKKVGKQFFEVDIPHYKMEKDVI